MELRIRGHDLPGRTCGGFADVHVGVQVGRAPAGLVPADASDPEWRVELEVVDDGQDVRGPAVQGRRGERFVYLTWGQGAGDDFVMFRRAKLMLADLPATSGVVTVDVDLTDDAGLPRAARLRPPAVRWSAQP
ncbi:DUF5990 family protein [Cellulomonas septica]|uniref:Monooxygenase n=1 Tax=Cellulomonas septica TaxID=285080 RepID=A0ABX1K1B9_9CELL|nr:hypothetical protein [Cellulomonas septica]